MGAISCLHFLQRGVAEQELLDPGTALEGDGDFLVSTVDLAAHDDAVAKALVAYAVAGDEGGLDIGRPRGVFVVVGDTNVLGNPHSADKSMAGNGLAAGTRGRLRAGDKLGRDVLQEA